jgi:hypothetical protein
LATGTGTAAKKAGPLVFRLLENQSQFAIKKTPDPSAWISPRFLHRFLGVCRLFLGKGTENQGE